MTRLRRPRTRITAGIVSAVLAAAAAVYVFALPLLPGTAPALEDSDPVAGRDGIVQKPDTAAEVYDPLTVTWPTAVSADIPVSDTPMTVDVGGLPVTVSTVPGEPSPGTITIETFDQTTSQAAGVAGVLVKVTGTENGKVNLATGYAAFAGGYGGEYGSRLRLYQLPTCAITNPSGTNCSGSAGEITTTKNDSETHTLSATVDAVSSGVVLAVTASDDSAQGDYKATALSPSSSWTSGGSSGAFTWSYPISVPATPGGLAPSVALSYSSQATDGRTAATNNQGSWIGEGFSYEPGYIERSYKSCKDDGHDTSAEQCWAWDNATIMLQGTSGDLVKDGNTWRVSSDDNSKVERVTGGVNGDNDGEYWRVTTTDGTQYYFGLNRLTGWAAGDTETDSVWTKPVFGDDAGEPCYNATFEDAHCNQAWRWNLDYVVDPKGNAVAYFYGKETNHYALNGKTDVNGTAYTRGGYLKLIEYGHRDGAVYDTPAPARVVFTVAERCLPTDTFACDPADLNETNASYWPDVPFDRECKADTHCDPTQTSATFYTRKRLTTIETQVRGASSWSPVDTWDLQHTFYSNADVTRTLWLSRITRTGQAGGGDPITLPGTDLIGVQRQNRLDVIGDSISGLIRPRLSTIYTDSGGRIDVDYSDVDCTPTDKPTPKSNGRRCYPVKWQPGSYSDPITDWFHKYVVTSVTVTDLVAESEPQITNYEYIGDAAWRKPDPDGIGKAEDLTWSQWRGYQNVRVYGAKDTDLETRTDYTYFRGMDGDDNGDGGTRSISVPDSTTATHTDYDELAGQQLEAIVYNGIDTAGSDVIVSRTITTPWRHITKTATHTWADQTATYVRPEGTKTYTRLEDGSDRVTNVVNHYDDASGRITSSDDYGQEGIGDDNRCSVSEYADNTTKHMLSYVARTETLATTCANVTTGNVDRATQVISDNRTYYDNITDYSNVPTRGMVSKTDQLAEHDGTTATYATVATTDYDDYGRATTVTDALGNPTSTAYTDTYGLNTTQVATNANGHVAATVYNPAGQPASITDANGKLTELAYDALGRLTDVWLANRSRSGGANPNTRYTYVVRTDGPNYIKTESIKNDATTYQTSYALLDSQLRTRQTQSQGPDGGRLVTDTIYDALGRTRQTNDAYYTANAPSGTLFVPVDADLKGSTVTVYDNAGRATANVLTVGGVEKWRTTTTYGGDRTHLSPPQGGTETTTIVDARGNTTELRQYDSTSATGYDATTYAYTVKGELKSVTDPVGNTWEYTYDQRGRKIASIDPDTGLTTSGYDAVGNLTYSTDSRGKTLAYVYDALGRKTDTYDDTGTDQSSLSDGKLLAHWYWDTRLKGQLTATRAYEANGITITKANISFDPLYRVTSTQYSLAGTALGALAGSYRFGTSYNLDGTIENTSFPTAGGMDAESIAHTYDDLGRLTAMTGEKTYASNIGYYRTSELGSVTMPAGTSDAYQTYTYEDGTKRLATASTTINGVTGSVSNVAYTYDQAGNVTSIINDPTTATGVRDAQCFTYDNLRRMTTAWTSAATGTGTAACTGGADTTDVGGPGAYRQEYGFDATGNRTSLTQYATGSPGAPSADTTSRYTYPAPGISSHQPHTLTSINDTINSTTTGTTTTGTTTYDYDNTGNTSTVTTSNATQNLTWDTEGKLTTLTNTNTVDNTTETSSYTYDADGNRITRTDPDGSITAYLDGLELTLTPGVATPAGTRYYTLPGGTTYTRTTTSAQYQISDHHGTSTLAIDCTTGTVTNRYTDPYGNPRGTQPTSTEWAGTKGYVGGTTDPTGYTHIGAREYNPSTGSFLSIDPVIDFMDPQQINGYSYASGSPVVMSDPTGLIPICPGVEFGEGGCGEFKPGSGIPERKGGKGPVQNCYAMGTGCPGPLPHNPDDEWKYQIDSLSEPGCPGMSGDNCTDPESPGNDIDAYDLLGCFIGGPVTEHMVCPTEFHDGDWLTEALQGSDAMKAMRLQFAAAFDADPHFGKFDKQNYDEPWYQIIGDPGWFASGGNFGTDGAVAFIGGFRATPKVVGYNSEDSSIQVQWTVTNQTDIESVTHVGPVEIPGDQNVYGSGPLATTTQTIVWTETISFSKT